MTAAGVIAPVVLPSSAGLLRAACRLRAAATMTASTLSRTHPCTFRHRSEPVRVPMTLSRR